MHNLCSFSFIYCNSYTEPIKYRTLRKFCPSCGLTVPTKYSSKSAPHFPSRKNGHKYQNQNGLGGGAINSSKDKAKQSTISKRDIDNDKGNKEKVNKTSNKTPLDKTKERIKTTSQQTQRGNNDKKEVTKSKDKGNGRGNKEKDNKATNEKSEEKKTIQQQQPQGIKNDKKDGSNKSKDADGEKERQLPQEKNRGTQQQLQDSNTEKKHVSKPKDKSQDNAGGSKERQLMQNENDKCMKSTANPTKDSLGGEGKKEINNEDAAEVPKSRPSTELEKGKGSSLKDIKGANKKESTSGNHHGNPANHSRRKGYTNDTNIPLTKSPNIPKYTLKFTKGPVMPFVRQEAKAKDDGSDLQKSDDSSQRATGVFMMAAGLKVAKEDDAGTNINENEKEQNLKTAAAVVAKQTSSKQEQVDNNRGMPKKASSDRSKEKDRPTNGEAAVRKSKSKSHDDAKKELSHILHTTSKHDQFDDKKGQPKKPQSNNDTEKEKPTSVEVFSKSKPSRHDNAKEHSHKDNTSSNNDQADTRQTTSSGKEGQPKKAPSNSNQKDKPTSSTGGEVTRKAKLINAGNKKNSEGKEQTATNSAKDGHKLKRAASSGNNKNKSEDQQTHHAKIDDSINHTAKSEKRSSGTKEQPIKRATSTGSAINEKRSGTSDQAIKRATSTGSSINEKRSGTREQGISQRASTGITTDKHQPRRAPSTGSGDNKNKQETMNKSKKPTTSSHSDIAKKQKKDDGINQTNTKSVTLRENNGSTDRYMKRKPSSGSGGDEIKPSKALSNKGNTHGENKIDHHAKSEGPAKNELRAHKRDPSKGGIVGISMDQSRLSSNTGPSDADNCKKVGTADQRPSRGRSHHVEKGVRFKQQRGRSLIATTTRKSGGHSTGTSEKVVVDQSGVAKSSNNNDDDNVKKRYRRSKSMPQQRAQRIRVPSEYHVTKHTSTFSMYRQVFLDEFAQMSVQVPTDIEVKR